MSHKQRAIYAWMTSLLCHMPVSKKGNHYIHVHVHVYVLYLKNQLSAQAHIYLFSFMHRFQYTHTLYYRTSSVLMYMYIQCTCMQNTTVHRRKKKEDMWTMSTLQHIKWYMKIHVYTNIVLRVRTSVMIDIIDTIHHNGSGDATDSVTALHQLVPSSCTTALH